MKSGRYVVPFDVSRSPVEIIQGWHGPYSHFDLESRYGVNIDSSYAIDFKLPLETPVFAACAGNVIVVYTESVVYYNGDDGNVGNQLPAGSTNFLVIDHGDGTFALYSHLHHRSEYVRTKQSVDQGQLLAGTGLSGWIGQNPHLHFAVFRRVPREQPASGLLAPKAVTIPFRFQNYGGPYEHSELRM